MIAPFCATNLKSIMLVLKEGRCTIDTYMVQLLFFEMYGGLHFFIYRLYTMTAYEWLSMNMFWTMDGFMVAVRVGFGG